MARVSFLTDEHIPHAVARGLKARGIDVVSTNEARLLGSPDDTLLERARGEGRVLMTSDADFLRLHSKGTPHAGIAYVTPGAPIGQMIAGAMLVVALLDSTGMRNHVEFL